MKRLARWFKGWLYRTTDWHMSHGVRVSAFLAAEAEQPTCLAKVEAALGLIQSHAPAHLARLHRHVGGILVFPMDDAIAVWRQDLDACLLAASWVHRVEVTSEDVAASIIHELMHARLDAIGFPYDNTTRARVERICALAERNFAARLPPTVARERLEETLTDRLAIEAAYWSDDAIRRRAEERRRTWPFWRRAAYSSVRGIRWIAVRARNLTNVAADERVC